MTGTSEIQFDTAHVNGIDLHYAACGDRDAPLLIFLHGFPEYWVAWKDVMPHFTATHFCLAPDQRGYNLSSKPDRLEDYATKHMVEDLYQLAEKFSPGGKFILAGHDWGASVAYVFAMAHPERLERLVIVNGVHPGAFQTALLDDADQIRASQYFHQLRSADAESVLSENNYAGLLAKVGGSPHVAFLDADMQHGYQQAWGQPGALTGMLNWYRASPVYVPDADRPIEREKALAIDPARLEIKVPHLLIYGTEDRALRPASFEGVRKYAPQVEIRRVPDAGHWILHERPELVASIMADWLNR